MRAYRYTFSFRDVDDVVSNVVVAENMAAAVGMIQLHVPRTAHKQPQGVEVEDLGYVAGTQTPVSA